MLLDWFKKWKADRAELGKIESRNVFRRAELNVAFTLEKVKEYVNSQRTEKHHEKYFKKSRLYPQASKA